MIKGSRLTLPDSAANLSLIGLAAVLLILAILVFIPTPAIIETEQNGASIFFAANRTVLLAADECVTLRWQVEHIQAVYLNQEAQVGSGETYLCGLPQQPMLDVTFQDGGKETYQLPVWALRDSPALVGLVSLAGIAALLNWRRLRAKPAQSMFFILLCIVVGGLFIWQVIPLVEVAASSRWLEGSDALATIFTGMGLVVFLVIVAALFLLRPGGGAGGERVAAYLFGGAGLALLVVVGTILTVNPRGMYISSRYTPHQLILRGAKMADYLALPERPEVVVLGSSRAFTISPKTITAETGLSAYNMAVEGGTIEDVLILARQMNPLPEVLFIEIQPGLPRQSNDIAARAPLGWLPHMRLETALLTLQNRFESLINLHHFAEAVYIARYARLYARQPKEWPLFEADGMASRAEISAAELEQNVLVDIGGLQPIRCDSVDEISRNEMDALILKAASEETALVFYVSPYHPQYYDERLKDEPDYQRCQQAFVDYMNEVMAASQRVFLLDFSLLTSIGGSSDETGYFDAQHLTAANGNRLIAAAADTLRAAYSSTLPGTSS